MLALALTFLSGRYHATPWDRHVNEGAVAWPPEPWRILRALTATWHHKVKHDGKHSDATFEALIESLAIEVPEYALPAATHAHARHYMPQFAVRKTSLIFDAFAAVRRTDSLGVVWPNVNLPEDQRSLLDDLLAVMGYLGRAESWVEARRVDEVPIPNCKPSDSVIDENTGEIKGELITLYVPMQADEYQALRGRFLIDKKASKKLGSALPEALVDALCVETSDLRKLGWSQPPAARKVSYLRPLESLRSKPIARRPQVFVATSANFIISGKPLPRVEDTLHIGELVRMATMAQCKRSFGEGNIPPIFSGHGLPESNRHGHAFYLPWDSNGDGQLDRVLVYVPDGMRGAECRALEKVQRLWKRDGTEWRLVLEGIGDSDIAGALTRSCSVWESITPYLHPWHVKKRFKIEDQIRRECRERDIPEPVSIEVLDEVDVGRGRKRRAVHFHRFRNRRGLIQPDRVGSFRRLTFHEPIVGPLALGFGCHYGLGLFRPIYDQS